MVMKDMYHNIRVLLANRHFRLISTCVESSNIQPSVDLVPEYHDSKIEEIKKVLKVSFVGVPNSGKSTLINRLVGRRVCSVSSKVHTTRCQAKSALVRGNTQIVFVDTPGLVSQKEIKKHKLETTFESDAVEAANSVHLLGIIHDVSNRWTRNSLDSKIIKLLQGTSYEQSVLILNKVDLIKKKEMLLQIAKTLSYQVNEVSGNSESSENENKNDSVDCTQRKQRRGTWSNFSEVFMMSALTGDGTDRLIEYMFDEARIGRWVLPQGQVTEQPVEKFLIEIVRAKLLDFLPQEIPYELNVELEYFNENELGEVVTVVLITCPVERIKKVLLSGGGKTLKRIAMCAEEEIRDVLQASARLRLVVTSLPPKKKWWEKK